LATSSCVLVFLGFARYLIFWLFLVVGVFTYIYKVYTYNNT